MKRPNEHIIGEKAERIFEDAVPDQWVRRQMKPDYGIDYLIEIFENNLPTGKTFFVQLKGSEKEIKNNKFSCQFEVDTIKYYQTLALPVLIVFISINTKQIWAVWANKLLDVFDIDEEQQEVSISLDEKYLINESFFNNIIKLLRQSEKLGLVYEKNDEVGELLHRKIEQWVDHYFADSVSVKFNNLPGHLKIKYIYKSNKLEIRIDTPFGRNRIKIENINATSGYLHKPIFDADDVNDFNFQVLRFLSFSLAKTNIKGALLMLQNLVTKLTIKTDEEAKQLDPVGLCTLAIKNGAVLELQEFMRRIIEEKNISLFFFFDSAYFILTDAKNKLHEKRIDNLNYLIAVSEDRVLKGTCYYNIGNILRSNFKGQKVNEALKHYFLAKEEQPDYLKRNYWWREIAGLFFNKKHFSWAEKAYVKSIELPNKELGFMRFERDSEKGTILIYALIADCFFMQGKWDEALKWLTKYLSAVSQPEPEWLLKDFVIKQIVDRKCRIKRYDEPSNDSEYMRAQKVQNIDESITILEGIVSKDALNFNAWFNLGVAYDKKTKLNDSLFSFLACGLINEGDNEAMFNALTVSFTTQNEILIHAILSYLKKRYGKIILNELSEYMLKNRLMTFEAKKMFIQMYSELYEII